MIRSLLCAMLALAALPAFSDVRIHSETDAVSVPDSDWELRFPGEGWQLEQQRQHGDGRQYYYMFGNLKSRLIVSFFLEPAYKCENGEACRANFWRDPGPGYLNPKENRRLSSGQFSVIEFTTAGGQPYEQKHWSAHMVHEGVWIDMHMSAMASLVKDFAPFEAFARTLQVSRKDQCPQCLTLKGLSRKDSMLLFSRARAGDAKAWDRLQELAKSGDAEAQYMTARVHSWGASFLKSNERESATWVQKAAEQGHAQAQTDLGFFKASGRGMDKKDVQAALLWWTRAAEQGYAPAQLNLGNLYTSDASLKDEAKALEWMQKAAKQGLAPAQLRMGDMSRTGAGTPRDIGAAMEWYRSAALQGSEQGMINMAVIYSLAGAKDKKLLELAVVILGEPVLGVNESAKSLKAKLCGDNPGLCPGFKKPPPPAETGGKEGK